MAVSPAPHGTCAVCRRADQGVGYAPPDRLSGCPVVWTCRRDITLASTVHHMPQDEFNRLERDALADAGVAAGQYLDGVGKTDLATLTDGEWQAFLAQIIAGFGDAMRERLGAHQAPF